MINCIVLEDEELAAKSILKILSKVDRIDVLGHFYNPLDAQNGINLNQVDLVFLDVEMPEITGLEFIKSLTKPPAVIVTTSKSDFALGAFEIEAVDFILKPVTLQGVLKALSKFESSLKQKETSPEAESVFVKVDGKLVNLKFRDIKWIEALGDYVGFHTEKKRYVVKSTLSAIEERIADQNFIKVHRSFIVNVSHIRDIDDSSLVIDDKLIPVSRGNRPELLKKINLLK